MNENCCNKNIRGPAMDRAHEPAKFDLAHDVLNAFVGGIYRRGVVKEEQDPGEDLYNKKKKTNAPKIIPEGIPMFRNFLFFSE